MATETTLSRVASSTLVNPSKSATTFPTLEKTLPTNGSTSTTINATEPKTQKSASLTFWPSKRKSDKFITYKLF